MTFAPSADSDELLLVSAPLTLNEAKEGKCGESDHVEALGVTWTLMYICEEGKLSLYVIHGLIGYDFSTLQFFGAAIQCGGLLLERCVRVEEMRWALLTNYITKFSLSTVQEILSDFGLEKNTFTVQCKVSWKRNFGVLLYPFTKLRSVETPIGERNVLVQGDCDRLDGVRYYDIQYNICSQMNTNVPIATFEGTKWYFSCYEKSVHRGLFSWMANQGDSAYVCCLLCHQLPKGQVKVHTRARVHDIDGLTGLIYGEGHEFDCIADAEECAKFPFSVESGQVKVVECDIRFAERSTIQATATRNGNENLMPIASAEGSNTATLSSSPQMDVAGALACFVSNKREPQEAEAQSSGVSTFGRSFEKCFQFLEYVGRGSYGVVAKCTDRVDDVTYAVKRITVRDIRNKEKISREAKVLAKMNPKYVVRYYGGWFEETAWSVIDELDRKRKRQANTVLDAVEGVLSDVNKTPKPRSRDVGRLILNLEKKEEKEQLGTFFYLQMEWCGKGSLRDWLNRRDEKRTKMDCKISKMQEWLRQIVSAVCYIHGEGFIHRDLKPENILLSNDEETLKIADFGAAREHREGEQMSCQGTEVYMAPEVEDPRMIYNQKADVFAIGLVYAEMVCVFTSEWEHRSLLWEIRGEKGVEKLSALPREAGLVAWLTSERENRPSSSEVSENEYFREKIGDDVFCIGYAMPSCWHC